MRKIEEGKTYRHFKGNVYKVLYIGNDSQADNEDGTPKKVVVYKSNHDGQVWVREYENFASKVDREKYPMATQEYRFEEVD